MDTPTYEPTPEPDRTPRPNPITDKPATLTACANDYDTASRIRAQMDKQHNR